MANITIHIGQSNGSSHWLLPVWLNDLLPIFHSSVPVLQIEAHSHGLVHHVKHVHVCVRKESAHLLQTQFTDLQQFIWGYYRVKGLDKEIWWSVYHKVLRLSLLYLMMYKASLCFYYLIVILQCKQITFL